MNALSSEVVKQLLSLPNMFFIGGFSFLSAETIGSSAGDYEQL
jgi:hypothetical protein